MKKILFIAFVFVTIQSAFSQGEIEVGITGGYLNVTANDADEGNSGFYAGLYSEISLTNSLKVQPELLYGNIEDQNLLYLPVVLKYYVAHSDLNLQAGPQATYLFKGDNDLEFKDQLGLDLTVGVGYDIFHNIYINARYGFKIAQNDETFSSADFNTFMVGLSIGL
ncbi:outer membrane beta-barrel protein [Mesonia phycicola]|nr:outer membrane beta-barrel protein [Mesonia phycicola]